MAKLINDIEWGEPILPIVQDPEWEAEVKADMGMVRNGPSGTKTSVSISIDFNSASSGLISQS